MGAGVWVGFLNWWLQTVGHSSILYNGLVMYVLVYLVSDEDFNSQHISPQPFSPVLTSQRTIQCSSFCGCKLCPPGSQHPQEQSWVERKQKCLLWVTPEWSSAPIHVLICHQRCLWRKIRLQEPLALTPTPILYYYSDTVSDL